LNNYSFSKWRRSVILNTQKCANCNLSHGLYSQNLCSRAYVRRDRLKGCPDIMNFRFSIWRPSVILNFGNMLILPFYTVYSHNLHVPAKVHRDWLNDCRDFEFSIFNMAAIRRLDFIKSANFNFSHGI